jgi:hypothetical protein
VIKSLLFIKRELTVFEKYSLASFLSQLTSSCFFIIAFNL